SGERNVDTVVDQQRHAEGGERRHDRARALDHGAGIAALGAQLHERGAALCDETRKLGELAAARSLGSNPCVEAKIDLLHGAAPGPGVAAANIAMSGGSGAKRLRTCISSSLRRHDPDQVRWVGSPPLSPAAHPPDTPLRLLQRIYESIEVVARGAGSPLDAVPRRTGLG